MKVAFVGKSGSGKSTLAKLLLGLYWPEQGIIELDGRDLRHLDVKSVRRQMGIVSQDPYIFGSSVRENILLNNPNLPPQKMIGRPSSLYSRRHHGHADGLRNTACRGRSVAIGGPKAARGHRTSARTRPGCAAPR